MEICHYCGTTGKGPSGPVAPKRPMLIPSLYLPFPLGVCCDCIKVSANNRNKIHFFLQVTA